MRKKLYSLVLLAAGLLCGTHAWAGPAMVTPKALSMVAPHPDCYDSGFASSNSVKSNVRKAALATSEETEKVRVTYVGFNQVYTTLAEALANLPQNSTPATIKLESNVSLAFEKGTFFTVEAQRNVTIDLNGFVLSSRQDLEANSQVIKNLGTLTIEDNSTNNPENWGKITNLSLSPSQHINEAGKLMPTYGNYTIMNLGTLTLNSGIIENASSGGACYVIEMETPSQPSLFTMNGGIVRQSAGSTVMRAYTSSSDENKKISVIINDGEITTGNHGFIMTAQYGGGTPYVSVTINGGTFTNTYSYSFMWNSAYGAGKEDNSEFIINGGTFKMGMIDTYGYYTNTPLNLQVNGGVFDKSAPSMFSSYCGEHFIKGGTFCNFNLDEEPVYEVLDFAYNSAGDYKAYSPSMTFEEFKTQFNAKLPLSVKEDPENSSNLAVCDKNGTVLADSEGGRCSYSKEKYSKEQLESAINKVECGDYSKYDADWKDYPNCIWGAAIPVSQQTEYQGFRDNEQGFIAEGYIAVPISGVDESDGDDLIIGTLSKDTAVVSGDVDAKSLINEKSESVELTETTDLVINNTGENAKITFNDNATVNKITVTSDAAAPGEAQIVVKDGVTLNVGNGGIVSENDVLTTVLVETGGTLIVGMNGIDKEGQATPIEIQASEGKGSGILVFSPNSKAEDTKKYAEVDLYTYCKKVNDKYHWQQFAIPVTGLDNSKVAKNPNVTSYVFEWDYATYGWSQLSDWSQLDEPFAGYDMTNVSENGGVVYTFKGDLIGNQNIQLTLPHKDYCVMGNSYTAPIDIVALFKQIDQEMDQSQDIIEKTVYKYDAKAGYYIYTNELEQTLAKMGIVKASFTDIKPMEGFLLNLQNGNTAGVMLNYANAVFAPAMTSAAAPARKAASTDLTIANISVSSANYTDRMTLVESEEFSADIENGKDAYKYINEDGINFYAFSDNAKLAMVASNNIEGTNIAFQSAADDEYTLTFQNVLNNNYELLDMQTNISVPMVEGNTYTFSATPNTLNPSRFMVVSARMMPTDSEQVKAVKDVKGIYTMLGQYMGEAEVWSSLPQGVYVVNGMNMVK